MQCHLLRARVKNSPFSDDVSCPSEVQEGVLGGRLEPGARTLGLKMKSEVEELGWGLNSQQSQHKGQPGGHGEQGQGRVGACRLRQQPEREGDKAEPHPAPAPDGLVRGCGGPGGSQVQSL